MRSLIYGLCGMKVNQPFSQFGVEFPAHWAKTTEMGRRMACARGGRGNVPVWEHRRWIIEHLWDDPAVYDKSWPYEDGSVSVNPWALRRIKSFNENTFNIWMGPGGVGKTRDAAAIALEFWLEDPEHTAVIVCSTTAKMLRVRIWNDICQLWHALPQDILGTGTVTYKGLMNDTDCRIRFNENDKKNGIFGIAVAEGPVEDAVNNIVGVHTTRYLLVIDELQGTPEAVMADTTLANIASNPEVHVLGMGNPTSIMSLLCKMGTPVKGWNSVVRGETEEWDINSGPLIGKAKCNFFDGRKSPAILNPEWGKNHLWMKQKAQVDAHIAAKGENDPSVWTMTIGWPPPLGTDNTVLDIAVIEKFRCRESAIWTDGFKECAALDPAFVDGGDDKILQFFRVGKISDEDGSRWVIEFGEWVDVPFNVESDMREYQIMAYVRERCQSKGIPPQNVATDSTGIGRGLLSVFHAEWGPVVGVEFGGKPSTRIIDTGWDGKPRKASDVFDRCSSELNIMVRNFAAANGIRGLSKEAEKQFCQRLTFQKLKQCVEKKSDMKTRVGTSPGHADAACIAVELAGQMGAVPAQTVAVGKWTEDHKRKLVEADRRFDERNYAEPEDWREWQAVL